jgi:riboflavin kinase/FMN adenylyltransferase
LTTLEQKLELLEATGAVDECLVLAFDEARSKEPAEDFVGEVLAGVLGARLVVVGADFHFGRGRGGDVALLQRMGAELGFEVLGVGLEGAPASSGQGGTIYSSTRIRELLAAGDVRGAAVLLGRPHEARGVVVEGDRRGRELGYPTANVAVPSRCCLPADGIYAGTVVGADGVERMSAISLGRRPTFYETADASLLEAYVLDFDGDLYGQAVKVRFVERLRGEQKFESVDALIVQIEQDVAATRRVVR